MSSNEGNQNSNRPKEIENIQLTIPQIRMLARRPTNQEKKDEGCHTGLVELMELSESLEDYVLDLHMSVRSVKAHHQALIIGAEKIISATEMVDQKMIDPFYRENSKMGDES